MTGAGDGLLQLGAGNELGETLGDPRREDRVGVAEEDERGGSQERSFSRTSSIVCADG